MSIKEKDEYDAVMTGAFARDKRSRRNGKKKGGKKPLSSQPPKNELDESMNGFVKKELKKIGLTERGVICQEKTVHVLEKLSDAMDKYASSMATREDILSDLDIFVNNNMKSHAEYNLVFSALQDKDGAYDKSLGRFWRGMMASGCGKDKKIQDLVERVKQLTE